MPGKIFKVKLGYNPNSSSIGSLFSAFLWVAAAGSFLLAAFADLRTENKYKVQDPESGRGGED